MKPRARFEQVEVQTDYRAEETGGFCFDCNELVARDAEAKCAAHGHGAERVSGLVPLEADGSLPFQLPGFNWGAALMPPVWGPIHGMMSGALLLPVFIFANNALRGAIDLAGGNLLWSILTWSVAITILAVTAYFMFYYGKRGWGVAWNQSPISQTPGVTREQFADFIRREYIWTSLCAALFVGFMYLVVSFWVFSPV